MDLAKAALARWQAVHQSPPKILYHYTTAAGLLSMLKDGHVWATESQYMNDPREFVHGSDLFMEAIDEGLGRERHPVLLALREQIAHDIQEKMRNMRIFFVSFCEDGDLLSQWRGYGDAGGGYSLGFRSDLLFGPDGTEQAPVRVLRKVVYNPDDQRDLVASWLDAIVDASNPNVGRFWLFFSEALVCFKDKAYAAESEWRLLHFGRFQSATQSWSHPVSFRERRGRLIPYADLDLSRSEGPYSGKLPICEIVDGPTQDPERSGKALRLLIESLLYDESQVDLRPSRVPFTT